MKHSKITLAVHHDADGIASGVLLCKGLGLKSKDVTLHFPEAFGDVTNEDYVCDMCPIDPTYKGIVYDHHPGHPSKKKRNYKLIHGDVPAGVVVFNKFKNKIPKKDWWKVVCSAVGDMQPESIPLEIFREFPNLLNKQEYLRNNWGNDEPPLRLRTFNLLSSPINALTRFGELKQAFDLLYNVKSPEALINNPIVAKYKRKQKAEVNKIYKAWGDSLPRPLSIKELFLFAVIDSDLPMHGYMASKLHGSADDDITTIVLNLRTGALSIRGMLTNIVKDEFNKNGIESGGHAYASGGNANGKGYKDLVNILNNII